VQGNGLTGSVTDAFSELHCLSQLTVSGSKFTGKLDCPLPFASQNVFEITIDIVTSGTDFGNVCYPSEDATNTCATPTTTTTTTPTPTSAGSAFKFVRRQPAE